MSVSISTVTSRDKLKVRDEPYYVRLARGRYLGFRKMSNASAGTWVARLRDDETGRQLKRSFGALDHLPGAGRYDAAKKLAEEWFAHFDMGGTADVITVREACEVYVKHVRAKKGGTAAGDIEGRFERWVYRDNVLADCELPKLKRSRVEAWRAKLEKTQARVDRSKGGEPVTRPRSPASVNRDMTALRAALNHAHDRGYVTSDIAWRVALRPIENAVGRRNLYLDRDQRRALIAHAPPDLAGLLQALSRVPLRPGAMATLTAGDFDRRLGVLAIGRDKAGGHRKIKLPADTAAFFAVQAKDTLPTAPLLARADGKAWDKDSWKLPLKAAVRAAKLPEAATAYTLRHSVITDLVAGGLDVVTVAQLSGTGVEMISRHYAHLLREHATRALAGLIL